MSVVQQVINKSMLLAMSRAAKSSSAVQTREFQDLYEQISRINASELNYRLEEQFQNPSIHGGYFAPVIYMNIHENEQLNASVFTIRKNRRLPLHDHPNMIGFIKIIYGRLRLQSYSYLNSRQRSQVTAEWDARSGGQRIGKLFARSLNRWEEKYVLPVIEHRERTLTVDDPPQVLTPDEANIHCLKAFDDDHAAFFDVLTPPYYPPLPERDCHYFQLLETKEKFSVDSAKKSGENGVEKENVVWLIRTQAPGDYFCEEVHFRGPFPKALTETELREGEINKM